MSRVLIIVAMFCLLQVNFEVRTTEKGSEASSVSDEGGKPFDRAQAGGMPPRDGGMPPRDGGNGQRRSYPPRSGSRGDGPRGDGPRGDGPRGPRRPRSDYNDEQAPLA